jgi:hypothetical protein
MQILRFPSDLMTSGRAYGSNTLTEKKQLGVARGL